MSMWTKKTILACDKLRLSFALIILCLNILYKEIGQNRNNIQYRKIIQHESYSFSQWFLVMHLASSSKVHSHNDNQICQ